MLLHLYLVLELLLHGHLLLLLLLLPVVVLILLLVVLLIFVGALVDLGDVRALRVVLLMLVGVIVLLVIFVAHVLFLLVLLDGLRPHHVVVHPLRYLRTFLLFFFFSVVLIFTLINLLLLLLLLLLLMILLEHEEVLLAQAVDQGLRGEVAGEVGGGRIESVVVLCREEELLLLVGQVGVGVQVCLSEYVHILLQLTDLCQVPHEGLGNLLDQEGLVGNVEKDLLLLLGVDSLQDGILLASLL